MKVQTLRTLIEKLQSKVELMFKSATNDEFPKLLENLHDNDTLQMDVLQKQSNSFLPLNMYGVLFSMQNDDGVQNDPKLLQELSRVLAQIHQEFPDLKTKYSKKNDSVVPSSSGLSCKM